MERVPEPELMDEAEQARAYAEGNFEEPHQRFVDLYAERTPSGSGAVVVDLGCGPADVTARFALRFPACTVHGIDAAQAMLDLGQKRLRADDLETRVKLHRAYIPGADLPPASFDTLISNSLLHHLQDPAAIWSEIKRLGKSAADIFVMDLRRPKSEDEARALLECYAAGEPDVLRRDFFHSLKASYRVDEVVAQLDRAGLSHFLVEAVSDRHLIVTGRL